jgi:hypothetical protein
VHFDVKGHDTYNYDGVPFAAAQDLPFGWGTHAFDSREIQSMWNKLATNVNGGSYPVGAQ